MQQLGLSKPELEHTIFAFIDTILARGVESTNPSKVLAEAIERALHQVANAIVENNRRITEQLEKVGVKIT